MSNQVRLALDIATTVHRGQFRRDGVTPYITHPIAVADSLSDKIPALKAVALLHDVLEDTDITEKYLLGGGVFPEIVEMVKLITKKENQNYLEYILAIKSHPLFDLSYAPPPNEGK